MGLNLNYKADNTKKDTDFDDGDYETIYLNDAKFKSFKGKASLTELKEDDYSDDAMVTYLVLKETKKPRNADKPRKLVCRLKVPLSEDEDGEEIIEANKKSNLYAFLDSLYAVEKGTKLNENARYTMYSDEWEELVEMFEEQIDTLKVDLHPHSFKNKKTKETNKWNTLEVKGYTLLSKDDDDEEYDEDEE